MYYSMTGAAASFMSRTTHGIAIGLILFMIITMAFPLSVSSMTMLRVASWVSLFFLFGHDQQSAKCLELGQLPLLRFSNSSLHSLSLSLSAVAKSNQIKSDPHNCI